MVGMNAQFTASYDVTGTPFLSAENMGAKRGSDAYLLRTGNCNILFDAGLACGGDALVDAIENSLQGENLDYILLSHSHYDHAPGAAWCKYRWPDVKIIATGKAASVFTKPGAIATMRHLDGVASKEFGVSSKEDHFDLLKVDIPLEDGHEFSMKGLKFRLVGFPGHTRCSAGFYFEDTKTLLGSETLGVYSSGKNVATTFLIGHKIGVESLHKALKMDIQHMLIPHFGFIHGQDCKDFLNLAVDCCGMLWDSVTAAIDDGKNKDELIDVVVKLFFDDELRKAQPKEAFVLNAGYVVDNIVKEYKEQKNDNH